MSTFFESSMPVLLKHRALKSKPTRFFGLGLGVWVLLLLFYWSELRGLVIPYSNGKLIPIQIGLGFCSIFYIYI